MSSLIILKRALFLLSALTIAAILFSVWVLQPPPSRPLPPLGATLQSVVLVVPGESRSGVVDIELVDGQIARITASSEEEPVAYVLPGLSDAHMHEPMLALPGHRRLFAFLHLYHGVTGARMAAGSSTMRDAIDELEYAGPQMKTCGPFIDGDPPLWPGSLVARDEPSARAAVLEVSAQGFDCIKVYNELTEQASAEVYRAASELGLPVIGHVPWRQDMVNAYIDDLQHVLGWAWPYAGEGDDPQVRRLLQLDSLNLERLEMIAAAMLAKGSSLTPTLITLQRKFALQDYENLRTSSSANLLPEFYPAHLWHPRRGMVSSRLMSAADFSQFESTFPLVLEGFYFLHQQGVEIHSGTDSASEFIVPGAGLHEELRLMERAGLEPEQVLAISSVATSRYLFGRNYGQLEVGSPAEMVVYSRDPTENLENLDSIQAVVRAGRYYPGEWLQRENQSWQDWFNRPEYQWVTNTLVGSAVAALNLVAD